MKTRLELVIEEVTGVGVHIYVMSDRGVIFDVTAPAKIAREALTKFIEYYKG